MLYCEKADNHGGGIPFNRPISHRTILGGHRIKTEQALSLGSVLRYIVYQQVWPTERISSQNTVTQHTQQV